MDQKNAKSIQIGIPKEGAKDENRVALSPQAAQLLIANGHDICVEKSAGERAGFSDAEYLLAGASVTENQNQVWQCPLIIKMNAPTLDEIAFMKMGHAIISCASQYQLSAEAIDQLNLKKSLPLDLNM